MKNNLANLEDQDSYNERKQAFDQIYRLRLIIDKAQAVLDKLKKKKHLV